MVFLQARLRAISGSLAPAFLLPAVAASVVVGLRGYGLLFVMIGRCVIDTSVTELNTIPHSCTGGIYEPSIRYARCYFSCICISWTLRSVCRCTHTLVVTLLAISMKSRRTLNTVW